MSNLPEEYAKVIIPMVRTLMPDMIARDIVSVQPMAMGNIRKTTTGIDTYANVTWHWVSHYNRNWLNWDDTVDHNKEVEEWVIQTFGKRTTDWPEATDRWFASDGKYYFRDESDLLAFMLKWE